MKGILKSFVKDILDRSYFWATILFALTLHLSKYDFRLFIGNIIPNAVIVLVLCLITNRYSFAFITTIIINIALRISANLKAELLASTLNLSDIDFVFRIRELAGEDLILSYMTKSFMLYSLLLFAAIFFFLKHSYPVLKLGRNISEFVLKRLIMIIFSSIILTSFVALISTHNTGINAWMDYTKENNINECISKYPNHSVLRAKCFSMGPVLDVIKGIAEPNLTALTFSESSKYIKDKLEDSKYAKNNGDLPNIFLILNESIFDPSDLDYDLGSNVEFEFFNSSDIKQKGYLKVHTFGGGSSLSEFPSLTGILHDVFDGPNTYPFLNMAELTRSSIFTELKKSGYYNIVIYPNKKEFLNARNAFKILGADRVVDVEDYGYMPKDWRDVSESLLANIIMEEVKNAPSGMPVFVSVATIRNHGPHDKNYPDKIGCIGMMEEVVCSKLNDYIARLKHIDSEWADFSKTLLKSGMKYILVNFGDHQPSFEGEMDSLKMKFKDGVDTDIYRTFYTVRSNIELNNYNYPIMDISYIPSLILDYINRNNSEFYRASSYAREKCNGLLDKCEDLKLVESFKSIMTEQLELKF
jgi:phosphoglycerol transferase MdoB-like AlkP superfamily enzyme